jgi:hypothetical protein
VVDLDEFDYELIDKTNPARPSIPFQVDSKSVHFRKSIMGSQIIESDVINDKVARHDSNIFQQIAHNKQAS